MGFRATPLPRRDYRLHTVSWENSDSTHANTLTLDERLGAVG